MNATKRNLNIVFPRHFVFGNGVLAQLTEELHAAKVRRVILMSIEPLKERLQSVIEDLKSAGIMVTADYSIQQEPSFADLRSLLTKFSEVDADTVIGIGGGSVLDIAKLIAALLDNDQKLEEVVGNGLLQKRNKRLICIPATSGTGSEVSPNAILVDDEGQKKGIISPNLVPDAVYADPLLTLTLPGAITAATGLDALTHCLEAFTNRFSQPFIDMFAIRGIKLIADNLVSAVQDGANEKAREEVALGSILGGFCLGPVNTAAVHALSYPLGTEFHLAHGLSNALLLPYVMEFNYRSAPQKYAEVAIALGCPRGENDEETARKGIDRIRQIIDECGIPSRLGELDIPKEAIPKLAEDALKITRLLVNNPREVTLEDAISIYRAAY